MKHSTDRILTTHAGRLDGPPAYREMTMGIMSGKSPDPEAVSALTHSSIVDVLRKQAEAGIDIVSDGELGKIGFGGLGYYGRRLSGLTSRKLKPGEPAFMTFQTGERLEFADFYKEMPFFAPGETRAICAGPIAFTGQQDVKKDMELFHSALGEAGTKPTETFMCVLAPGWLEHFFLNEYYSSDEEYLFALADAMKPEYKAVVDAGFVLQLDDPALPDTYDMIVPMPGIEEYRKFAEVRVDAMNHALRGFPKTGFVITSAGEAGTARTRTTCRSGTWST